jgi:hypothetical protein
MKSAPGGVDAVRLYLQKRIDRCGTQIAAARKRAAPKPRTGGRRPAVRRPAGRSAAETAVAARRAYRDALRALETVRPDSGTPAAVRLAREEVERVKAALAKIYEVTQHGNHDVAEAGDWSMVEGEAQTALNIVHEAEAKR